MFSLFPFFQPEFCLNPEKEENPCSKKEFLVVNQITWLKILVKNSFNGLHLSVCPLQ